MPAFRRRTENAHIVPEKGEPVTGRLYKIEGAREANGRLDELGIGLRRVRIDSQEPEL